jgi:Calcineurin-like phosphoesterase
VIRKLADDTLVVFLSDCHIGGDEGRDIFESPDDLVALFEALDDHDGPVELVLAGDFFDFLRIAEVPEGETRASVTMSRPEYRELFAALQRFASGGNRTVVYLPGNHDAEAWWNREIRAELERGGLVHEFALSYSAAYESDTDLSCTASTVTSSIRRTRSAITTIHSTRRSATTSSRISCRVFRPGGRAREAICGTSTASFPSPASLSGWPGGRTTSRPPGSCAGCCYRS